MKQLFLIVILTINFCAFSQDDKTVTLTVTGQGQTKDEAKQNALRDAIEQAFGTFISSRSEILNDELVKDEVVSVSNGNIQKFEVISEVQIPDGGYATTLKATVSVTKLKAFVKSKGIEVEFKGNILAANVKQQILNEQNENKSIVNVVSTCKEILEGSCDFDIVRGEPKQKNDDNNKWTVPISINVRFNENIEQFNQYFLNSVKGICMTQEEVSQYQQLGKKTYKIALGNGNEFSGELRLTGPVKMPYLINRNFGRVQMDLLEKDIKLSNSKSINFQIIFPNSDILFETNDIETLKKKIRTDYREEYYYERHISIRYFENSKKSIYHFRTMSPVVAIIDLINYTKHSVLNFEITNGIDTITPKKLIADLNFEKYRNTRMKSKGYGFKVIDNDLTPIFNSRCNFGNYSLTSNGPSGIFQLYYGNGNTGCGKGPSLISIYKPITKYNQNYYYNGGRSKEFQEFYNTKYGFLTQADNNLSSNIKGKNNESDSGYQAVVSLFDFKTDGNKVITFYYEDILSLIEIEKVQGYKITPVSKN